MRARRTVLQRSFVLSGQDLGRRVASGAGFKFLGIGLRTVVTIGSTAVLARLLTPADFGYIAMAAVITEFAALFSAFGFTNVLIQRRRINRLQIDTVFWATAAIGCLLAVAVGAFSYLTTWVFDDPQVAPLLRVMALTFALNALTSVSWVVLSRLLRFRQEFFIQSATVVIRAATAIGCALAGLGVWSLVAGSVVGSVFAAVLSFLIVPYMPRLRFNSGYIMATWRTSGFYFAQGLLYYVNMNVDLIIVGRHLGATALGYYQNARSLTDEIRARIAAPLQNVLFPAFSSVQGDPVRIQGLFMRAGRLLATAIFPVGFAVSATAHDLVPLLYGPQWLEMTPLMSLFGLSAAMRGATAISAPLLNASNRVGLALKYNLINTALMLAGVFIALPYGIEAVATAVVVASLYPLLVFRAGMRVIGLGVRHMVSMLWPPIGAASAMWLVVYAVRPTIEGMMEPVALRLGAHAAVAGLVYVAVLSAISRQHIVDAWDAAHKLLGRT